MERTTPTRLRTTLHASTLDGCFHAAMVGLGELYVPALALLYGATVLQVGLLTTLPMLVGTAFQLAAPAMAREVGNKRWVVSSAALQAVSFLPLIALAAGIVEGYPLLLASTCAYWALALGINPVWNAWVGKTIPERIRGRYFANRNAAIQVSLFIALFAGGTAIQVAASTRAGAALGFGAVFLLAMTFRFASAWQLSRQHDPSKGARDGAGLRPGTSRGSLGVRSGGGPRALS